MKWPAGSVKMNAFGGRIEILSFLFPLFSFFVGGEDGKGRGGGREWREEMDT